MSQQVYAAIHQGDPTAFLLWQATPRIAEDHDPGCVLLLQSVNHYVSWMGRPASRWDNRTFANRGDVSYGTAPLAVWDTTYLHLSPAVYVPSDAAIYTSLAGDTMNNLLGPYGAGYAGAGIIRCRKNVYVPALYVGLLLGDNLTLVEARNRLRGAIVDAAAKATCRPVIDWLRAAIVRSGVGTYSALVVSEPLAPLPDALLLQHRHQLLLRHLTGLKPSINFTAGTGITDTVREVALELRETRLENKHVQEKNKIRGRQITLAQTFLTCSTWCR